MNFRGTHIYELAEEFMRIETALQQTPENDAFTAFLEQRHSRQLCASNYVATVWKRHAYVSVLVRSLLTFGHRV